MSPLPPVYPRLYIPAPAVGADRSNTKVAALNIGKRLPRPRSHAQLLHGRLRSTTAWTRKSNASRASLRRKLRSTAQADRRNTMKTLYTDDTPLEVLVLQLNEKAMQSAVTRAIPFDLGLRVVRRADGTLESLDNRQF